jgi:two-component system OmpR family sensor kinase
LRSEKRSLKRFLTLYFTLITLLTGGIAYYYYESQRTLMLSDRRATLAGYAYEQTKRIKALHQAFPKERIYPRDDRFTSAIYDIEYTPIFSLNHTEPRDFFKEIAMHEGYIQYIKDLDVFYLGARYLVIEIPDDGKWQERVMRRIFFFGGGAFALLALLGFFLSRRFVKPMRDAILLLDRFIADTTHELNTPLSTILTNIESVERETLPQNVRKKFDRIAAAAKQVSVLYRDLTYLVLEKEKSATAEPLRMDELVRRRIEYFETVAQMKRVTFHTDLVPVRICADRKDMERLLDNLLSNAVKYNRRNGTITVRLEKTRLDVEDTGIGIDEEKIPLLFDRYMRFSRKEGGFGVGLSIVKSIADRYGWNIEVFSTKGKGTRFTIEWNEEQICH